MNAEGVPHAEPAEPTEARTEARSGKGRSSRKQGEFRLLPHWEPLLERIRGGEALRGEARGAAALFRLDGDLAPVHAVADASYHRLKRVLLRAPRAPRIVDVEECPSCLGEPALRRGEGFPQGVTAPDVVIFVRDVVHLMATSTHHDFVTRSLALLSEATKAEIVSRVQAQLGTAPTARRGKGSALNLDIRKLDLSQALAACTEHVWACRGVALAAVDVAMDDQVLLLKSRRDTVATAIERELKTVS